MDRISSDFRAALRRHVVDTTLPAQVAGVAHGTAKAPGGTMTPPSACRRSWAGFLSSGWFFFVAAIVVTLFACWLVITLFGCGQGCCGGVAW